jgi:hypothetical protein
MLDALAITSWTKRSILDSKFFRFNHLSKRLPDSQNALSNNNIRIVLKLAIGSQKDFVDYRFDGKSSLSFSLSEPGSGSLK